ncbi:F0F1 ATP synthase subunit A [Eikenella corrodens]|uniref:ATP synthase subunit a n=1 Tax=Eikenella corrodens TaxID=539 RepID=A0A1A9RF77_EIKCO|nr:F0F1 ATP synthase subunit A [Eikenella corrodens]OAM16858.1 F0F1 ATP synthase subunit A [Eikenella corrodens]OAM22092.1 F0F1 ATP synthase subunit A [Eikenella corrodens]
MAGESMSAADYIKHHLQSLTSLSDVSKGQGLQNIADFSFINLDSLFIAAFLAILGSLAMWYVARKATPGVPGRFQAAIEILFEFIDNLCKGIIHNEQSRKTVAPLGLALFVWIVLMNTMDLLPVDLLPWIWQHVTGNHHALLRVVPTADLNITLGMSIGVLLTCFMFNVKIKGLGGWIHELFAAPFGIWLAPFNFILNLVEFSSKTISHGMRLFGNMYAGELVFLLIAMLGGAWAMPGEAVTWIDPVLAFFHILAGFIWAVFHILVIVLQAFIFVALAFVYIGQAHSSH